MVAKQAVIRPLAEEDWPLLRQMYQTYQPLEVSLGLPPRDAARRDAWLENLKTGINLTALVEGRTAGHLVLMPGRNSAEMAVFVHQDYRRQGIATALTRMAVEETRKLGLHSLWVLISSDNNPARAGLLKFGFHTAWESMGEVKMVYRL